MCPLPRGNLLASLPPAGPAEHVAALLARPGLRIEHIISHGQASPPDFWYDQGEDEWVLLLAGSATLALDDGTWVDLDPGDWLTLPAHCRHRVERTASPTVWLTVFVGGG